MAPIPSGSRASLLDVRADVSDESDVARFFSRIDETFGPPDLAVVNAGISRKALLAGCETGVFDEVMGTNLTGAFLTARAALRAFTGRGGRMVFIGSIQSQGSPRGASVYAASKGGIEGLVASIARDYGPRGVRANQLVTGFVDTDLTRDLPDVARDRFLASCPLHRLPSVSELASLVLFLASDRAAGMNGATLRATGGLRDMLL
jgi:3-oxoacyl-[acyl-carrier protein] reductase